MEDNNRQGPGIFYAVVGVATLVVAIIGATFAFFSATAEDDATIQGNIAAAGGLYLKVTNLVGTGKDIVPLNINENETLKEGSDSEYVDATPQFASAMTNSCVDKNGNQVCQVYAIEVANKSTTSTMMIQGTLSLTSKAQNMYWKLIDVTQTDGKFSYDAATQTPTSSIVFVPTGAKELDAYAKDYQTEGGTVTGALTVGANSDAGTGDTLSNKTLTASAGTVYYVLVWLEETGAAQEDDDATEDYSGVVSFTAVDAAGNSTGITATF